MDRATRARLRAQAQKPPQVRECPPANSPPGSAAQRDERLEKRGRLPARSAVSALWDGRQWEACLMVPGPDGALSFKARGSGLYRTLEACDDLYRAWLKNRKEQP